MDEQQQPNPARIIMHQDAVKRNVGSLMSYYPSDLAGGSQGVPSNSTRPGVCAHVGLALRITLWPRASRTIQTTTMTVLSARRDAEADASARLPSASLALEQASVRGPQEQPSSVHDDDARALPKMAG
jgi:hypothetical protein